MGKYISGPDDIIIKQENLFEVPGYRPTALRVHPRVQRDISVLKDLLTVSANEGVKPERGIDLEFDSWRGPDGRTKYRITIAAITTSKKIWAGKWDTNVSSMIKEAFVDRRFTWVAHAGIGADKPVIEYALGIETDLSDWVDTMITHYLCHQHLVKTEQKAESDDAGSLGLMNLWTAASLVTDMYNWKGCRGDVCTKGQPCPICNPIDYCGVDSWAGNACYDAHKAILSKYKVPNKFVRMKHHIAAICHEMEESGVRVDLKYVREMEENVDKRKEALFPYTLEGKKEVYSQFNPKSPKDAMSWFETNGIYLPSTEKPVVLGCLEKRTDKEGLTLVKDEKGKILGFEDGSEPSSELETLLRLYQYKAEGKGFESWFGDKYLSNITKDENGNPLYGFIHPRFISVGTSTGRLSSSKPNATNIFGTIRRAIIASDDSLDLMKADAKQLELRVALFLGGEPYSGYDVFKWLVKETGEVLFNVAPIAFPAAYAKDKLDAARKVAKSIAYGNLYGEGLVLVDPASLDSGKTAFEIEKGALKLYTKQNVDWLTEDWMYCGKLVAFTGVNMAERIFGEATIENRKKSLVIQEDVFFSRFNVIRKWQKRAMDYIQDHHGMKTASGQFIQLLGMPLDCAKAGLSAEGQGVGAAHVQCLMCKMDLAKGSDFRLKIQVHDELVIEQKKTLTDAQCVEYIRLMEGETEIIPGFTCPIEAKRGPNWGDMKVIWSGE